MEMALKKYINQLSGVQEHESWLKYTSTKTLCNGLLEHLSLTLIINYLRIQKLKIFGFHLFNLFMESMVGGSKLSYFLSS